MKIANLSVVFLAFALDSHYLVRVMSAKHTPNACVTDVFMGKDVPDSAGEDSPGETSPEKTSADEIERQIEADPTLVPRRQSMLLVEPSVLDRAEIEALLLDLGAAAGGCRRRGTVARIRRRSRL